MATIHISETAAAADFSGIMARVRAGEDVVIESGSHTEAIIRRADFPRRSISESIALAKSHSLAVGYKPVMDADFASDLKRIIDNRKPRDTSVWD